MNFFLFFFSSPFAFFSIVQNLTFVFFFFLRFLSLLFLSLENHTLARSHHSHHGGRAPLRQVAEAPRARGRVQGPLFFEEGEEEERGERAKKEKNNDDDDVDDHSLASRSLGLARVCCTFSHCSRVERIREAAKGRRERGKRTSEGSGIGCLCRLFAREEREPSLVAARIDRPRCFFLPWFSLLSLLRSPLTSLTLLHFLYPPRTAPDATELCLRGVHPRRGHCRREGAFLVSLKLQREKGDGGGEEEEEKNSTSSSLHLFFSSKTSSPSIAHFLSPSCPVQKKTITNRSSTTA